MTELAHLKFNDPAPDLEIETTTGAKLQLSSLWQTRPLVLAFVRHFGCPQCKELLDQLAASRHKLDQAGLALALVTQAAPAEARAFLEPRAPGVTGLADPERRLYAAFGLGRGSLTQTLLSPRVWASNFRLSRKKGFESELPPPGQDAMQMSGVFVIASDGRIRLPYYYDDIADHPSVDLLLLGVLSTDWNAPFEGPLGAKAPEPPAE